MEKISLGSVYHGSPREFDSEFATPRRNIRSKTNESGIREVTFDMESFHATPHKWIALAYMYDASKEFDVEGVTARHSMGVDLYEDTKQVAVYGTGSLEESLEKLYGEGGYLYHFNGDEFLYTEGLGNLEVIAAAPVKPLDVEKIADPISEMKKLGVTFVFSDLSLPENRHLL